MPERPRCPIARAAVAFIVAAPLLAGCGSGSRSHSSASGIAARTPDAIVAAAGQALAAASTVTVTGTVSDGGDDPIALRLRLVAGRGATGSLAQRGASFQLIAVRGEAYVQGSAAFWQRFGGAAPERLLHGKWLRAPTASGPFASFGTLTARHGTLVTTGVSTVAGRRVVAVRDSTHGATLYVAASGTPYPVEIVHAGTGGGRIDFTDFDAPVALQAPSPTIDITKLHIR